VVKRANILRNFSDAEENEPHHQEQFEDLGRCDGAVIACEEEAIKYL
jgi:hypothetical protein